MEEQQCAISTSWQRSCRTDDETGQLRCETLKRTYRLCPGKPPEIVNEEKVLEDGSSGGLGNNRSLFGGGPPSLFGGLPSPWSSAPPARTAPAEPFGADPFQMMERMEQRMQAMMGSFFGTPPSHRQAPPGSQHESMPSWSPPPPPPQGAQPPHSASQIPIRVHET